MRRSLIACTFLSLFAVAAAAQTIRCESVANAYRECRVGMSGTIRLVMEISEGRCFEGTSWGTLSPGVVWVRSGCHATFAVQNPIENPASSRIVCESLKGTRSECIAKSDRGLSLVQQLSKQPCVHGESWGFNADGGTIWVDHGCRGIFTPGATLDPVQPVANLDVTLACESDGIHRQVCPAFTEAGVQIIRQLSDAKCAYGQDWSYDTSGIWVANGCRAEFAIHVPRPTVATIQCESLGAKSVCPAETKYGVALVRQLSEKACTLDASWGFDDQAVWVANGCRGKFALGGFRLPPASVPPTAKKIVCQSTDAATTRCPVDASHGAGLVRQLNETLCVLNRNWGYDAAGIWVSGGCQAEFAVAR